MNNDGEFFPVTIALSKDDPILSRFPYISKSLLYPGYIDATDIRFYRSETGSICRAEVDIDDLIIIETVHGVGAIVQATCNGADIPLGYVQN